MTKDALLQVRIDPETKKEAEKLFSSMGMTFSEAVRIFAAQSVREQRLPFTPSAETKAGHGAAFGILGIFASPAKREQERGAWLAALESRATHGR